MWAIIGGSGFEKFDKFKTLEVLNRNTPFGMTSSGFKKVQFGPHQILFIPRHGEHHEMLPSEVNYRGNIFALKKAGATRILSVSAVGSLQAELEPGHCVVPYQYMDKTKGLRKHTFLGELVVGHVSLAKPICLSRREKLISAIEGLEFPVHFDKTYICIEGPYFSTEIESHLYRNLGGDIIGMTNFPEYALAREAGLCYIPTCFVTDFDCWDSERPHVTLEEVLAVMKLNNEKAIQLAQALLALDTINPKDPPCGCKTAGLKTGLMTTPDRIPLEKRPIFDTLLK